MKLCQFQVCRRRASRGRRRRRHGHRHHRAARRRGVGPGSGPAGRTPAGDRAAGAAARRAPRRPRHAWAALDRRAERAAASGSSPRSTRRRCGARASPIGGAASTTPSTTPARPTGARASMTTSTRPSARSSSTRARRRARWARTPPSGSAATRRSRRSRRSWPWSSASGGAIVGYTVGNDLSAWDIERENPLFLPQSKIFQGSFAFGPVIATPASIPDAARAHDPVRDRARRRARSSRGRPRPGTSSAACEELVDWLGRYNPIPPGTVLSTGTGILVPDDRALAPGDVVSITIDGIGTLRNPVRRVD